MTQEKAVELGSEALTVAILLAGPVLLAALVIGLIVGMFQAATQINEQTLSFLPRLLVTLLSVLWFGPWILHRLSEYTERLLTELPFVIQ